MITNKRVREVAIEHGMYISMYEGEWRITPMELRGDKAERVAYYTDDNDDALCTIVAMRRVQDRLNKGVKA